MVQATATSQATGHGVEHAVAVGDESDQQQSGHEHERLPDTAGGIGRPVRGQDRGCRQGEDADGEEDGVALNLRM